MNSGKARYGQAGTGEQRPGAARNWRQSIGHSMSATSSVLASNGGTRRSPEGHGRPGTGKARHGGVRQGTGNSR